MNREELQEEIRFLYGLWYRYFNLYTFLQKDERGIELIPKLRERQHEILRLIDFAKDKLQLGIIMVRNSQAKASVRMLFKQNPSLSRRIFLFNPI